jgi:hypothetical protein
MAGKREFIQEQNIISNLSCAFFKYETHMLQKLVNHSTNDEGFSEDTDCTL